MLLFIKIVSLIRIFIAVHLMVFLIINTLEDMRTRFVFLHSKLWQVHFNIFFVALCYLSIILRSIRSVLFIISRYMKLATESWMILFPTVFTLRNTRVCIGTIDSSNVFISIKLLVDNHLGFESILWILDIDPDNS